MKGISIISESRALPMVIALLMQYHVTTILGQPGSTVEEMVTKLTEVVETQSRMLADTQHRLNSLTTDLSKLLTQLDVITSTCKVGPADCNAETPETKPSCLDWYDSGSTSSDLYHISLPNGNVKQVYCDMDVDGGGWMVIQRRQDGSVDFQRTWDEYKEGFGDPIEELWFGNKDIYEVTNDKQYELRIDLVDCNEGRVYAVYSSFAISDESDKYRLKMGNFIRGNSGDSLRIYHNGLAFSTMDRDNDGSSIQTCSLTSTGGWWYGGCGISQLNSQYYSKEVAGGWHGDGIHWNTWHYDDICFTEMKIRPVN